MRPLIGITANFRNDGEMEYSRALGFADQRWHALADDYIQAVLRAGGIPVILPVMDTPDAKSILEELLPQLDGVLFSGGSDVDPRQFGERAGGAIGVIVPERDAQELSLCREIFEHSELPVLGICRGLQVMNVALGGTLYQDVQEAGLLRHNLWVYPRAEASHKVQVEAGSRLADICGKTELGVNSLHHMAIKDLSPQLRAVARTEDGLVEAVEPAGETDRFFLGVQWHPEMMSAKDALQQGILNAFAQSCRAYALGRAENSR